MGEILHFIGSFEFDQDGYFEHKPNLKEPDTCSLNDEGGASADDPRVMFKVLLLAPRPHLRPPPY